MSQNSTQGLLQTIVATLTLIYNTITDFVSKTVLYVFPENAYNTTMRYDFMTGGDTYLIDLQQRKIQHYTGQLGVNAATTPPTDSTLLNLPADISKIKSMMIFTSDADSIIQVGQNTLFNDHRLVHILNNLDYTLPIVILPPSGKVPNKIDLNFILSTKSIMPYDINKTLNHTKKFVTNQNTTSGFADLLIIHMGGYDQLTVAIQENNVNDVKYQVLVSEDFVNWYVLPGNSFPVTITKNSYALFTTTLKWHFYRVQIADNVGGVHGQVSMQASPIR